MTAFSADWFTFHQGWLVTLLNFPCVRVLFRRMLHIDSPHHLVQVRPDGYTVVLPNGELVADFRTHHKYAKRLYYSLWPVWWVLHAWDWAIADRWVPAWSAQLATLTQYPEPYTGAVTATAWGASRNVGGENWATIRAGSGTGTRTGNATDRVYWMQQSGTVNLWQGLQRSMFNFNTAALTAGATIASAVLSFAGSGKTDNMGITPDVNVYGGTVTSPIAANTSDFESAGSVSFSTAITYAAWQVASVYNDFTLNASGLAAISKTGVSLFTTRNENYDAGNVAPAPGAWSAFTDSNIDCIFPDTVGTATDPKLVVTYTSGIGLANYLRNKYSSPNGDVTTLLVRDLATRTGDYDTRFRAVIADAGGIVN